MSLQDKILGCIYGGAVGDALGYPVEFISAERIFSRYGECGITEYSLTDGVAQISDDTQMTLFTLEGLLRAENLYSHPIAVSLRNSPKKPSFPTSYSRLRKEFF